MLNRIYFVINYLFFISIFSILISIRNKDKRLAKCMCWINAIYIIYSLSFSFSTVHRLKLDIGFEIFMYRALAVISVILYLISFIKSYNLSTNEEDSKIKKWQAIIVTFILIVLPQLLLMGQFIEEMYYINNSKVVFTYYNPGNGGIGDSNSMAFAIGEKYKKEVQIGANSDMDKFITKNKKEKEISPIVFYVNGKDEFYNGTTIKEYSDYSIEYNEEIELDDNVLNNDVLEALILDFKKRDNNIDYFRIIYIKEYDYYIMDLEKSFVIYNNDKYIGEIHKSISGYGKITSSYNLK